MDIKEYNKIISFPEEEDIIIIRKVWKGGNSLVISLGQELIEKKKLKVGDQLMLKLSGIKILEDKEFDKLFKFEKRKYELEEIYKKEEETEALINKIRKERGLIKNEI